MTEYSFKILVVGDDSVGKTSLILRLCDNVFISDHVTTHGDNVKTKAVPFGKKSVKILLADTAGQERFRTVSRSLYQGAQAIVVVYDQANQKSFQNVQYWLNEIERYGDAGVVTFVVANKNDLPPEVNSSVGKSFADGKGVPFFETCARNDFNVDFLFQSIVQSIGPRLFKNEDWNRFRIIKEPPSGSSLPPSSAGNHVSSGSLSASTSSAKRKMCNIF